MNDDVERAERNAIEEGIESAVELVDERGAITRWITIVELVSAEGRQLHVWSSGADGSELPPWDESGFLFEALHHRNDWGSSDDSDDD